MTDPTIKSDDADDDASEPDKDVTMLLSRVAESVYWAGRYLERAEGTARLVRVHSELFFDLPRAAAVGWSPLLAVTGTGEAFFDRHDHPHEEAVIEFLASSGANPGSITSSIAMAHSNFRLTRAVFPGSAFEVLNELHHHVTATAHHAVDRRTRPTWMDHVIDRVQRLNGLLSGVMSHDAAYAFFEIGRHLERADMTTRVLDVQAGTLMRDPTGPSARYSEVTWMGVLRTLSANQMFRRAAGGSVTGHDAVRFLLRDERFPRSVEHCLIVLGRLLLELPRHSDPMARCAHLQDALVTIGERTDEMAYLHEDMDLLQQGIADMHDELAATYFGVAAASGALTSA
jgi:uncharacterized alpha-E superfamily protein